MYNCNRYCVTVVALVFCRIEAEFPCALMVQKAKIIFRIDIVCVHGSKSFQNIVPKVTMCNLAYKTKFSIASC